MIAAQQIPTASTAPAIWQNPQATPMYPGSEYAAAATGTGVASWNPSAQVTTQPYVSAAGTYPNQAYQASPSPAYATAPPPPGLTPSQHSSTPMAQPGVQPNMIPGGGVSPPGHPHHFVR